MSGVKKKLTDIVANMTIKMGNQKTIVEFEAEFLFDEATHTIRPPKNDDGVPPGFYEILLARCEDTRQLWD